jgi:hypothetical protein
MEDAVSALRFDYVPELLAAERLVAPGHEPGGWERTVAFLAEYDPGLPVEGWGLLGLIALYFLVRVVLNVAVRPGRARRRSVGATLPREPDAPPRRYAEIHRDWASREQIRRYRGTS